MHSFAYPSLCILYLLVTVSAQTWCNKNYMSNETAVAPGGQFSVPESSATPLMAFRCSPAIQPYLDEDATKPAGILVDALVTYTNVTGAVPIMLPATISSSDMLLVTISLNGNTLAQGNVPLNASKFELPFSLAGIPSQKATYNISCTASYSSSIGQKRSAAVSLSKMYKLPPLPSWADLFSAFDSGPGTPRAHIVRGIGNQVFEATATLSYLPNPPEGSVTKMDLRTGALLAKPANGSGGDYEAVFPIGFYTTYDGYLASNFSILDELKAQGFTVVHPVPPFDNQDTFNAMLDHMQDVGLYLMYDMRLDYMDSNAVTQHVNTIKSRPNLLLWYTADEPDGTSDPLNATSSAYDLIYSLDGYHPVSLVLNCQDYEFTSYASGADILLQDPYMISNNVTFSTLWHTPCNTSFGCCGCDNCKGRFEDISDRVDTFKNRLQVLGRDRTTSVWGVPQAFGNAQYWPRTPTGMEWVVQSVLAINHGAVGIVPWVDPTTLDIKSSASNFAQSLPEINSFLFNPNATFSQLVSNRIDVGLWMVGSQTLLLATNMNYNVATLDLGTVQVSGKKVQQIFNSGSALNGTGITFQSVGSGAFVLS